MPNNKEFLDKTGLSYYHNRAKTIFENKIEKVKVNGTEQTITNKEVDLSIPTAESNNNHNFIIDDNKTTNEHTVLTLNSTGADRGVFVEVQKGAPTGTITRPISTELASVDYVDSNGGKIDKIKVNGTEQTITNKDVDLWVGEMALEGQPRYNVDGSGLSVKGKLNYTDNQGMATRGNATLKMVKDANGVKASAFIENSSGMFQSGFADKVLPDKTYVDAQGSIAIDSANNNKTTFTVGNKTSSLTTSPDGVIYTEGTTATEVPSKAYVDDAIADITGMEFVIVDPLPATGDKGIIYLVGNQSAGSNVYDEYIWVHDGANGRFEKIGSTDVDLDGYWNDTNLVAITTAEIDEIIGA